MNSALYGGVVTHVRLRPRRHSLRYRVIQGFFDLDELPLLDRRLRWFGYNRAAPVSFHDKDHGDGSGDLQAWVEAELERAGLEGPWGALRVLCMPRMLGYVFNPLSVYFCHAPDGRLKGLLYEVNNTFGERHAYALGVAGGERPINQVCDKAFYVSPFMQMRLRYEFNVVSPEARVGVKIIANSEEGPVLDARFVGTRRPLTDRALLSALAAYPAMTLKVTAGIYWEALKLALKRMPLAPRGSDGSWSAGASS